MAMVAALRETGSILVRAPRDQVYDLLYRRLAHEPSLRAVPAQRLEAAGGSGDRLRTFVLRDEAGGTRVIHARCEPVATSLLKGPNNLRLAVQAELYQLQNLVQAGGVPDGPA